MPAHNEPIDEERMTRLETAFVQASGSTCSTAFQRAIQSGLTVLVSEGDKVIEVSPNGDERIVKTIVGPTPARPGSRFTLR
jgi:hypothetical protein